MKINKPIKPKAVQLEALKREAHILQVGYKIKRINKFVTNLA